MFRKLWRRTKQNNSHNNQTSLLKTNQLPSKFDSQTNLDVHGRLLELEKEINREQTLLETKPIRKPRQNITNKLIWTSIFLGIPVGLLYIVNLPYSVIRQPVAEVAPLLLLPSQISIDYNFKQSTNLLEQAEQLIENPTSYEDLDLGQQRLQEAKKHLNAIPLTYEDQWVRYNYRWYSQRFSWGGFQRLHRQVGQLEAKIFQEKNAQTLLLEAESTLNAAKSQYQQSTTFDDKKKAIATWQSAINKLEEIPSLTLAGRSAEKKFYNYEQELEQVSDLIADQKKVTTVVTSAQEFARQAIQQAQNPPYTVAKWVEIENLWEMAIDELQAISSEESEGYAQTRKLIAEYTTNLGEIRLRRQVEADIKSV